MNPKILLLISLVLIVLGLSFYGYFKAVPAPQNQTENRPRIEINPKFFNFGKVEYGRTLEYVFKVKNSGNKILEIKKVATSCGCTKAKIEKEAIDPGEEVGLNVKYDTDAMSGAHAKGRQERIVYLKSNDPVNPLVEVMISAYVQ